MSDLFQNWKDTVHTVHVQYVFDAGSYFWGYSSEGVRFTAKAPIDLLPHDVIHATGDQMRKITRVNRETWQEDMIWSAEEGATDARMEV